MSINETKDYYARTDMEREEGNRRQRLRFLFN